MAKDYYLLGEILWGMKEYFHNPNKLDYLKKFLQIDKERYVGDVNELYFSLGNNYDPNENRELCLLDRYIIAKDDNNNYIIGSPSSRHSLKFYPVIYKSKNGLRIFDDEFGICIKPEMMREFHEEYTRITNSANSVRDYRIDLGSFDGLSHCTIDIGMGSFVFQAGNFSGTPQYEKDKRRFFIYYNNLYDKIGFCCEILDENVIETLKKILTIKIPKKLLHSSHQQMIENSGVLDSAEQTICDIAKICAPLDEKFYYIDTEILEQQKAQKLIKK